MRICAMWKRTAARKCMALSKLEREVITDSLLKIQSIEASLNQIDASKVYQMEEIQSCLKTAGKNFRAALKNGFDKATLKK